MLGSKKVLKSITARSTNNPIAVVKHRIARISMIIAFLFIEGGDSVPKPYHEICKSMIYLNDCVDSQCRLLFKF